MPTYTIHYRCNDHPALLALVSAAPAMQVIMLPPANTSGDT